MKITQIRENGDMEALGVTDIDPLIKKMKKETRLRPVTGSRQALHFVLPDKPCSLASKLPRMVPAVVFGRVNGVKRMKTYNGIVGLTIGPLAGKAEMEIVKQKAAKFPQTMLTFVGAGGKSVKIQACFTRLDGALPQTAEETEVFQAHIYRPAIKRYQPQLPFSILLEEPKLKQFSRLSCDPDLVYRPAPILFYLSQPIDMPGKMTYHEEPDTEASPLNRALPEYDTGDMVTLLYEAILRKAFKEMGTDWRRNDRDLQTLVVPPAENRYYSDILEKEVTRRIITRYYKRKSLMLARGVMRDVYKECKGVSKSSCLTKGQRLSLQINEFMDRHCEFRYSMQIGEVEYRECFSFQFYFHSIDKRAQNSIVSGTQPEGIGVWDRDIDRYLHSSHVPVYNPLEEFLFHLPHRDSRDRIYASADRVPCENPHWKLLFHRRFLNMVSHWRGVGEMHANNTSPILVGRREAHKSTFCRGMIPPALHAYYTDSIDFSQKRDAELYLNRLALINIDEFDQIILPQQGFLKCILQEPVVNLRKPHGRSVFELQRYVSFTGTNNQKDLLTDPSENRRFICIEATGDIDITQPIDYERLYAQAIHKIYHGERYWFGNEGEQIMTENNREFEQIPAMLQLFHQYLKAVQAKEEGGFLTPVKTLNFLKKKSSISLFDNRIYYFGRLLQKCGIPPKHTYKGTVYQVIKVL